MKFVDFLSQNIGTIIVLALLSLIVFLVVFFKLRAKKQGKGGCSCGCADCPMSGKCHGNAEN